MHSSRRLTARLNFDVGLGDELDNLVTLLTVEDHFSVSDGGLTLAPDFPMPQSQGWKQFSFIVVVRTSGEPDRRFRALASPVHFHVRDPSVARRGWRLLIVLPAASKGDVPIGSIVLCEPETIQRLFDGDGPNNSFNADALKRAG